MKKLIKRLGLFILIIFLLNYIFIWFYEKPQRLAIKNGTHNKLNKWKDIHSHNKYNVIILGSSRGYCAYNPEIIDSLTKDNSYNMCTGSQNIIESYYMLKEIFRYQKPKLILYEIFLPSFRRTPDYYQVLSNTKFMSTKGKYDMIINGFGAEGLMNYLLPVLKYEEYMQEDFPYIFKQKIDDNPGSWHKGYYFDKQIVDSASIKSFPPIYSFNNTIVMTEKEISHYIELIQNECKRNAAELIFVRSPYPPSRLRKSPADTVNHYFNKISIVDHIPFYDFNYLFNGEFKDSDFKDYHHMNCYGANKVTKHLSEIINKTQLINRSNKTIGIR